MRRALMASLLCARLLWPAGARGDEESKKTCAAAFTAAQRLMRSGSLHEARKKLVLCGGPQCPALMRPDCQQWLANVEASIPTVVFQVYPQPLEDLSLSLDGGDSFALDGRAISVDPGNHNVTFMAKGFLPVTKQLVILEGEKLQRETVVLEPAPPSIEIAPKARPALVPPEKKSSLTWPLVVTLSGTALAGIGAVYFGVNARSDDRALQSCYGECSQQKVDHVRNEYLWANISMGVAAAGLATAVVLWLVHRHSSSSTTESLGRTGIQLGTF
jgi:hypothetical protein